MFLMFVQVQMDQAAPAGIKLEFSGQRNLMPSHRGNGTLSLKLWQLERWELAGPDPVFVLTQNLERMSWRMSSTASRQDQNLILCLWAKIPMCLHSKYVNDSVCFFRPNVGIWVWSPLGDSGSLVMWWDVWLTSQRWTSCLHWMEKCWSVTPVQRWLLRILR